MPKHVDENKTQTSIKRASFIAIFSKLLLLMLKLKARRAIFLVVPLSLTLFNIYLPKISSIDTEAENGIQDGLTLYAASDLASLRFSVLVDRSSFPVEVNALGSISVDRGGSDEWLKDCPSDRQCRSAFISEFDPSVTAYARYSKDPSKPAHLECRWVEGSSHKCAMLHQLMAQSALTNSTSDGVFKDVQIFTLFSPKSNSTENVFFKFGRNFSLPKSACSNWIADGVYSFLRNIHVTIAEGLWFTTFGITFYLLFSTLACVRTLKSNGFFQQLVRNGLSPACFWTITWLIIFLESALFAGLFAVALSYQCPGIYQINALVHVFAFMLFYCIGFAALILVLELLVKSMLVICMLTYTVSVSLLLALMYHIKIKKKLAAALYAFPLMNIQDYTLTYLMNDMSRKLFGTDSIAAKHPYYENMLIYTGVYVICFVLIVVYADFLPSAGNGLCLPPYYPFSFRFWSPQAAQPNESDEERQEPEPHIEPVVGLTPSVVINNLSMSYKSVFSATVSVLDRLSCKIYRDQITALIGHNGAGKSTLIRILTGDECPDGGVAFINGIKITDPLDRLALRGSISVCPQFDSLCGELSALDNIRATLNSKGICSDVEVEKARAMLQRLGLQDKENIKSCDLSGGQKRKVNTILALLGDPQVIFLDEPTSGLDPVSRRQLWQLLHEVKSGRSIVLCTQSMDEADVLADRKIFLSGGQIVCAGSSMFLKRAFGCSFMLNVTLRSESGAADLLSRLGSVKLKSKTDRELRLQVPSTKPGALIAAVQLLEASSEVETFGLSQATLDELFMKLSGIGSDDIIETFKSGRLSQLFYTAEMDTAEHTRVAKSELTDSLQLSVKVRSSVLQQFRSLFGVNLIRKMRTCSGILNRFVIPIALLTIMFLQIRVEMANDRKPSSIRMLDVNTTLLGIVCVRDEPETIEFLAACSMLTFTEYTPMFVMEKSKSHSLQSFLSHESTHLNLKRICRGLFTACIIYYASSWDTVDANNLRNISVGVFSHDVEAKSSVAHALRMSFGLFARLFGAGDPNNSTAMSLIKPFSKYKAFEAELLWFMIIFGLFSVSYLGDPIEDTASRVRSHLISMGMSHRAYWINTFLLHWIQYIICVAVSVGLLCIWDRYRNEHFIFVCLPLLLLGTASNQMTVYTIAAIAKSRTTIAVLLCSLFALLLPQIFVQLSTKRLVIIPLVLLLPPAAPIAFAYYSLSYMIYTMDYYGTNIVADIPHLGKNSWINMYVAISLIAMPIHIAIMCCILALVENSEIVWRLCCKKTKTTNTENSAKSMDLGAQREAGRILQSVRSSRNVLEVRHLQKIYPNGVRAVKGLTFGTFVGEIFGLLGANGAGKTTSMSVIVGEEQPTFGQCEVRASDGVWVDGRQGASIGAIGYCPQHNPLFDHVTVAEHLALYAGIRGVPPGAAERQCAALIQGLGLLAHKAKCASQLSGGNKRRLCLAIALLGDPALIVIDEASTGVDPENKRFIWSAILGMLNGRRSVMVTTHCMEEVEALCSRIGIMNEGRMIAFGSVQQLRSLHGDAYTLDILLRQEDTAWISERQIAINSEIISQFPGSVLTERLSLCIQFCVPKTSVSRLSSALVWLEANQSRLGIDTYSFYQMSLDQVFVKLVRQFGSSVD